MSSLSPLLRRVLAALIALAAGLTITVAATVDNGPDGKPHPKATVTIEKKSVAGDPRDSLVGHEDSRDETPGGVSRAALEAGREQQDALAYTDQLPIVHPDAAPTVPGCVSRFVVNQSSRRGVAPRLLVAHYTVSHNLPGWGDVWAIQHFFDLPAVAASSNFVIDGEGHCAYIVPLAQKAWAQATFNPVAVSIEFVAYGDEGHLTAAQTRKGGQVFAYAAKLFHIPVRLGAVSGCTVTEGGIVDHAMLGACGGGHHDLLPMYSPVNSRRLAPLIAATRAAGPRPITAADRVTCRRLNWWRAHGRPAGAARANAVRRRHALAARGVTCTPAGPRR